MTKPNIETRVDTRDYEVRCGHTGKRKMSVVVRDGESLSIDELAVRFGVSGMSLRRRLRAMVSWEELTSSERGRTYDLLMPSIKHCETGNVDWSLFENNRDYRLFKQPHAGGKGGVSLMIDYQGQTTPLAELVAHYDVPYPTARKRIECGRSFAQVFSLQVIEDPRQDLVPLSERSHNIKWAFDASGESMGDVQHIAERRMTSLVLAGRSKLFPAQNAGPLYCEVGGAV